MLSNIVFFIVLVDGYPPWLYDFAAYYDAADRMLRGGSPYMSAQLAGPVDAVCNGCYLYPPFLAQVVSPLAVLPIEAAKATWFVLMTVAALASTWLATGIGGARRSVERAAWCVVATTLFVPIFHANYYGNVGSLVALSATLVAMGGAAAGFGAAFGALVKVVPGALVPAALVADRRSRWTLILTLGMFGAISFLLAPAAWLEYLTVFGHMLSGSTEYEFNLALANAAVYSGLPDQAVALVRVSSVAIGIACLVGSVWLARRFGGMPMAALAGTVAMLVLPATMWPHYLAVLLPFAAMAWPRAGGVPRVMLLTGAVIVVATGFGDQFVYPYFGSVLMVLTSGWVLWPRDVAQAGLHVSRPR